MKNSKSVGIALVCNDVAGAHLRAGTSCVGTRSNRRHHRRGSLIPSGRAPLLAHPSRPRDVAPWTFLYPTETNADGAYYLTRLQIGRYEIKIEAKGFPHRRAPGRSKLVLNQVRARVDVQLVGRYSLRDSGNYQRLRLCCKQKTTELGTHLDHRRDREYSSHHPKLLRRTHFCWLRASSAPIRDLSLSGQKHVSGRPPLYKTGNREQTSNYISRWARQQSARQQTK